MVYKKERLFNLATHANLLYQYQRVLRKNPACKLCFISVRKMKILQEETFVWISSKVDQFSVHVGIM